MENLNRKSQKYASDRDCTRLELCVYSYEELDHALKLIKYFESEPFIQELSRLIRLQDFCEGKREHFYLVLYHLREYDFELFSSFLQ